MTHKQAVSRAVNWAKLSMGYSVIIAELATQSHETPDVLAFQGHHSMLIECKISRSDFFADAKKFFRAIPDQGMGDERLFAVPAGLIKADEVPDGWGLLEIHDRQVRRVKGSDQHPANKHAEVTLLVSAMRRLQISTAVYVIAENGSS